MSTTTVGSQGSAEEEATLKSLIEDANDELEKKFDSSTGRSPAALRWKTTASLLRTVRAFNYLKEEPSDEAVGEIQRLRSKPLIVKPRSPEAKDTEENLYLEEAEAEEAEAEETEHLKPWDSAGGNIVHHVGCRAAAADLGPVKIRGWFMLQPFFGGVQRTKSEKTVLNPVLLTNSLADWFWTAFLPHGADRDHAAANVFGPNAPDISRLPLPPIFIIIGTHDILKDREVAYAKKMVTIIGKDNVTVKKYTGGFHAFFAYDLDLQKILTVDIAEFVQNTLAKEKS